MAPLDTQDMERYQVELRLYMERAKRRFTRAQKIDVYEQIVKNHLPQDDSNGEPNKLQLNSLLSENQARQLGAFLDHLLRNCERLEQFTLLEETLRDRIQKSRRKSSALPGAKPEPICFFCASGLSHDSGDKNHFDQCDNRENVGPIRTTEPTPSQDGLPLCLQPAMIPDETPKSQQFGDQQNGIHSNCRDPFAQVPSFLNRPGPPMTPPASVNPTPDPGTSTGTANQTPPTTLSQSSSTPVNLVFAKRSIVEFELEEDDESDVDVDVDVESCGEEPQDLTIRTADPVIKVMTRNAEKTTNASQQSLKHKLTQKRSDKVRSTANTNAATSARNTRNGTNGRNNGYNNGSDVYDNMVELDHEDSLPGLFIDEDYDQHLDIEGSPRSSTPLPSEDKKNVKPSVKRKRTEKRNSSSKQFKNTSTASGYSLLHK